MWKYIFRTTWTYLVALLLLSFIVYTLYVQFRGNPFLNQYESYAQQRNLPAYYALLARYGVDKPPVERFGIWLAGFFQGDWGIVFNSTNPLFGSSDVLQVVFRRINTSSKFIVPSYFIALILGFPLGVFVGYQFASRTRRGRIVDSFVGAITQLASSIPTFVWAIFALLIGPLVKLPTTYNTNEGTSYEVQSLILPTLILIVVSIIVWTLRLRIEIANVLVEDHILAARARGFSGWFILRRYVLRNALYPYVGSLFQSFLVVFGGSLIIERYFNIPGSSEIIVTATSGGEVHIVIFQIVFFGLLGALAGIFELFLQLSIDPRVKSQLGQDWIIFTQLKAFWLRIKHEVVINENY